MLTSAYGKSPPFSDSDSVDALSLSISVALNAAYEFELVLLTGMGALFLYLTVFSGATHGFSVGKGHSHCSSQGARGEVVCSKATAPVPSLVRSFLGVFNADFKNLGLCFGSGKVFLLTSGDIYETTYTPLITLASMR